MKSPLLTLLFIASITRAEVIECPARYPASDLNLAGGAGRVQPARLSFAYMHIGELHSEQLLQGPERRKVKGGWDTDYDFPADETKWLVCSYGGTEWSGLERISPGTVQWWGKVAPQSTVCRLQVREKKMKGSLSDWSVAATCAPKE
jgi:hypothetical protein